MAVAIEKVVNKSRLFANLLNKWGHSDIGSVTKRLSVQTGVADGGGDLTLTYAKKGDIILDADNDDYYLVTVAATTVIALN